VIIFIALRSIQTALLITAADVADGLCRQRNHGGNARRGDALGQLQKRQPIATVWAKTLLHKNGFY
jgi:hypothetical protein